MVDLGHSERQQPQQMRVNVVQEQIPEELIQLVSEVPEEVPKEQHICVELAQPTKEAAKPTAVLPVTEAISEESLHELYSTIRRDFH